MRDIIRDVMRDIIRHVQTQRSHYSLRPRHDFFVVLFGMRVKPYPPTPIPAYDNHSMRLTTYWIVLDLRMETLRSHIVSRLCLYILLSECRICPYGICCPRCAEDGAWRLWENDSAAVTVTRYFLDKVSNKQYVLITCMTNLLLATCMYKNVVCFKSFRRRS